jgi:hypothetical protein
MDMGLGMGGMSHPDDLALKGALKMGWTYDMSFDLFRKGCPTATS